ncbi:amidohydrolase [Desulfonatronum sp. SC1]|uniref:amidohydrolase n=1 Tax=Desulfonatronum sp. SC1 TaxID=2109626 RepID=UPI000D30D94F|nr:amidohydrolase [Desulfonatronum sp. SC1]PTN31829.1 amidohydrolase [Desulfonatronum sp. SC1]
MNHRQPYADSVLLAGRVAGPGVAKGGPVAPDACSNAVAVRQGRIAAIDTAREIRAWIGPNTEVVDVAGGLILPGFRDAHIHPILGGMNLVECNLTGLVERDACLAHIASYARANQDQNFIRGGGWLPDLAPLREHLDAIVPDRPVLLKSIDGHNAWVNTRALELAGITRDTPNPPGGIIERDAHSGDATGILREWTAMDLVESRLPAPTLRDRVMAGWAFLQRAADMGIVSVHEAMAHEEELLAYQALERDGDLHMRVQASLLCEPEKGLAQIDHLLHLRESFQSALLTPRTAKIFVDGVIEGRTALLLEPYADMPGYRGECLWPVDELQRIVTALDAHGFQIHFHAVGDQGVRLALDAVEQAQRENGRPKTLPGARPGTRPGTRHMIAHADLIHPRDIPRFQALGVIANLQPIWFCEEKHFARTTLVSLGEQRAWSLYPVMDLLNSGAVLTCGTDWPFSGELNTFNPLESIQIGVTRRGLIPDQGPVPAQSYNPAQCVSLAAMLHAHTLGGAYADFQETVTGSITVGKSADLIVLDRDILKVPADEISQARVTLTMFQGKIIHHMLIADS